MARPITRLLIANRGEIAVRIARTAHRLGIDTVGVYAEPDADALHVDAVDVAVALGGATAAESYLRGDAVIAAAVDTGCDAVHPGYGFLAENAEFARAVLDAGLTWVGPRPEQMALLGDKVAAKRAALAAGVPTTAVVEVVAGTVPDGVIFPALVKAAAGGGGRGMRVVRTAHDLPDAIAAASREALAAFGDGAVFIEPYIEYGRHVEVQIVGDAHGTVLHLGDRDCSIQRRNQKLVEEAPAPGLADDVRSALRDGALALARYVGYQGLGTVEFLVGLDGTVTFLEVNTRLQVEHPVTEAVTGLDLVELQLLVAGGAPLAFSQSAVRTTGHAIEVRVVAEDPAAGWLPSTGTVTTFAIGGDDGGGGGGDVRVDTGVRAGTVITAHYDSLVAKVIAPAPTRAGAARRLARALRRAQVSGVRTNLTTLTAILGEADFLAGAATTSYLDDHPDVLTATGPDGDDRIALLVGAVFAREQFERATNPAPSVAAAPSGWRNLRTVGQRQRWRLADGHDDLVHDIEYAFTGRDRAGVLLGPFPTPGADGTMAGEPRRASAVRLLRRSPDAQVVELHGRRHVVAVTLSADGTTAVTASPAGCLTWTLVPRFVDHDRPVATGDPTSPLPGTVIAIPVVAGQNVTAGEVLVVVEAMKTEHRIVAATAATVAEVRVAVGDRVATGDILVTFAPEAASPGGQPTPSPPGDSR